MDADVPVLVRHDRGCRYARQADGGHSDMAKRVSDTYNLHIIAGARRGSVLAFSLADGTSNGDVYDNRADAVMHQHHDERWFAFIRIAEGHMSVCQAESVMRWQRQAARWAPPETGEHSGGLEVIPRLTREGHARQLAALAGSLHLPIALGRSDPR